MIINIQLATKFGQPLSVYAEKEGAFAIHPTINRCEGVEGSEWFNGLWTLTHIASGFAVALALPTADAASDLAEDLEDQADWGFDDAAVVNSWPAEKCELIRAMIREASAA